MPRWITENWFDLLSAVGIIASLLFTAHTVRSDTKTRRISNLVTLTRNHRDIWSEILKNPKLERVVSLTVDIEKEPTTLEEEIFVGFIIQHLHSVYHAASDKLVMRPDAMRRDVKEFFSLPVPNAVWQRTKIFQNATFVAFVESCLNLE